MDEHITPQDYYLFFDWELGWSGSSYFKKGTDGIEYQAYWLEDDKLVRFQTLQDRAPKIMTRQQFNRLFN